MEFQLRDRVILLTGPFTSTVQSLMVGLTSEGADVALLDEHAEKADKFCGQLNDQREVKANYGRALAIKADLTKPKEITEAVGKVVQSFGGVDILIDAQMWNSTSAVQIDQQEYNIDELIDKNLKSTLKVTQTVVGFLKSRKKGRIIYLMNDCVYKCLPVDAYQNATRSGLISFSQSLAKQLAEHNVTVNIISLGATEEYLLGHYEKLSIKEAMAQHKLLDPFSKITEPDRITNSVVFLAGSTGAGVSGQVLRLS